LNSTPIIFIKKDRRGDADRCSTLKEEEGIGYQLKITDEIICIFHFSSARVKA